MRSLDGCILTLITSRPSGAGRGRLHVGGGNPGDPGGHAGPAVHFQSGAWDRPANTARACRGAGRGSSCILTHFSAGLVQPAKSPIARDFVMPGRDPGIACSNVMAFEHVPGPCRRIVGSSPRITVPRRHDLKSSVPTIDFASTPPSSPLPSSIGPGVASGDAECWRECNMPGEPPR